MMQKTTIDPTNDTFANIHDNPELLIMEDNHLWDVAKEAQDSQ